MSPADAVAAALDAAIPDEAIMAALTCELDRRRRADGSASVMVDGAEVVVPADVRLTMIEKALFKERHESAFPSGCRACVALGDTQESPLGLPRPTYCFARLFFDLECKCKRVEFRSTIYGS